MTSSIQPAAPVPVSESAARAHEQKNCLSIILAVASLVTPELSVGSRERMERLRAAAHRIRDLLNADLDESGDGTSDIDVQRLFDAVFESLRDRAEAANVALVLDCEGGRIRASEAELREALFNLISNAVEATPAHRAVFIHTQVAESGDHVWTIHDSGVGMRREVLDQIGVPHRSFRHGGSGLGVALARAIVNRHGGSLRFDSARGRGTTVTICLPPGAVTTRPDGAISDPQGAISGVHGAISGVHGAVSDPQGAISGVHGSISGAHGAISGAHGAISGAQGAIGRPEGERQPGPSTEDRNGR